MAGQVQEGTIAMATVGPAPADAMAATAGPAPGGSLVPAGILPGLWHLLSVLKVEVPPLRERGEEIPALFRMFAAQEAALAGRGRARALKASEEVLRYYSWPGNLNELSAVSRRYTALSAETASITPVMRHQLLIQAIGGGEPVPGNPVAAPGAPERSKKPGGGAPGRAEGPEAGPAVQQQYDCGKTLPEPHHAVAPHKREGGVNWHVPFS